MTTPLVSAIAQIITDWEGLPPPDQTTTPYKHVEGHGRLGRDASDNRRFAFGLPQGPQADDEAGPELTGVTWACEAELFLSSSGRTWLQLVEAVAKEKALLCRTFWKRSSWPDGVTSIDLEPPTTEAVTGGALTRFTFRIETEETD